jgi:hypothetical protein
MISNGQIQYEYQKQHTIEHSMQPTARNLGELVYIENTTLPYNMFSMSGVVGQTQRNLEAPNRYHYILIW